MIKFPVTQYTPSPEESDQEMKPSMTGIMKVIIFCWAGSMPACGVIFCTTSVDRTIRMGMT